MKIKIYFFNKTKNVVELLMLICHGKKNKISLWFLSHFKVCQEIRHPKINSKLKEKHITDYQQNFLVSSIVFL